VGIVERGRAEVVLPELGAGPVLLSVWFADAGDAVYEGDRLVEVLIGEATFDVSAPATGRLAEKRALPDDPLQPGQVLGVLEVEVDAE
jgi:pyruvate/2-oxoglutarate dehydrogenase complex dihydrolipoamide acyltransferase (E2) component